MYHLSKRSMLMSAVLGGLALQANPAAAIPMADVAPAVATGARSLPEAETVSWRYRHHRIYRPYFYSYRPRYRYYHPYRAYHFGWPFF